MSNKISCPYFFIYGGERGIDSLRSPCGQRRRLRCPTGCARCRTPAGVLIPLSSRNMQKKMPEHQFRHFLEFVAVRGGFEPPIRCRIHTFQACSFSHSDTSPHFPLTLLGQRGATIGSRPKRVKHYFSLFFYPLKLCSNRFIPAHYGQIVIKKKSCSHKNVTKASQT